MATIVSPGKTTDPKIERKNFRDMMDVPERIREIYLQVAKKLLASGRELPMWVLEVINKEK